MQSLIKQACALNNYEQLKNYGVIVRPDIINPKKAIVKYDGREFSIPNEPTSIENCLLELFQ
ncbi:MAG: hypothetical protein M3Q05_02755 [Bacteroidota bacterium]|nr:hypothetical protein [Bacteroidota bacterium]